MYKRQVEEEEQRHALDWATEDIERSNSWLPCMLLLLKSEYEVDRCLELLENDVVTAWDDVADLLL